MIFAKLINLTFITTQATMRGRQKVLSTNILDYNFFTIYMSVKRAFFTDSYESAADPS